MFVCMYVYIHKYTHTHCGLVSFQKHATKEILYDRCYFRPVRNKLNKAFKKKSLRNIPKI